ncbi:MAG: hypothetical protein H0W67_00880 [Gemmatimonadales bacterium]|nr:hypothetical protein [Gemmatimonadales bacterium]
MPPPSDPTRQRSPYLEYFQRDGHVADLPSATRKLLGIRAYQAMWSGYRWLKHEFQSRSGPQPPFRLALWRQGFFAESAAVYDFPRNDPGEYLSDFQQIHLGGWINEWDGLFNHKLGLRAFLLAQGLPQPHTAAFIYEGRILAEPFERGGRYVSDEEIEEHLRGEGEGAAWVVKPEDGSQGRGLFLLEYVEGAFRRHRGREVAPIDLRAFLASLEPARNGGQAGATLIERRLPQGQFWRELFPGSANTLRLLTLWTPGDPSPFIARAVQRVGSADTVPTDNWSGGGLSAPIDLATGRLGPGRTHPLKGAKRTITVGDPRSAPVERHPDTGALIAGAVLPCWNRITEVVLRAGASLPFNRMVGWDVLVSAENEPVILEANGHSDVNLLQVHGGLLADDRVRRFFEHYGAV